MSDYNTFSPSPNDAFEGTCTLADVLMAEMEAV